MGASKCVGYQRCYVVAQHGYVLGLGPVSHTDTGRAELLIGVQHQENGVYPRLERLPLEPFDRNRIEKPVEKNIAFVPLKPSP